MASLQVRELPELVYTRLKQAAESEHRSIAQQAIVILAKGLDVETDPKQRRRKLMEKIASRPLVPKGTKLPSAVKYIRQDRNR